MMFFGGGVFGNGKIELFAISCINSCFKGFVRAIAVTILVGWLRVCLLEVVSDRSESNARDIICWTLATPSRSVATDFVL